MTGTPRTLVMSEHRDEDGVMWRAVHLHQDGRLVIEGQDLGPSVERAFGAGEYEFERTLSEGEVGRLRELLGLSSYDDLLAAVEARFDSAHALERFLVDHELAGTFWSRVGD